MSHRFETYARETFVAGLRNAHAVERQTIAVLGQQLSRLDEHPGLRDRLGRHLETSRAQAERLQEALDRLGSRPSDLKDAALAFMGAAQSSIQGFAEDAVVKIVLADTMVAHFEIASYRALIEMSGPAGRPDLRADLERSLAEEEEHARWLAEHLPAVTRRHLELGAAAGNGADADDGGARDAASETGAAAAGEPGLSALASGALGGAAGGAADVEPAETAVAGAGAGAPPVGPAEIDDDAGAPAIDPLPGDPDYAERDRLRQAAAALDDAGGDAMPASPAGASADRAR